MQSLFDTKEGIHGAVDCMRETGLLEVEFLTELEGIIYYCTVRITIPCPFYICQVLA